MSQISFSDAEHAGRRKRTRREVFLAEMELVVPWKAQLKVIEPRYPTACHGRCPTLDPGNDGGIPKNRTSAPILGYCAQACRCFCRTSRNRSSSAMPSSVMQATMAV